MLPSPFTKESNNKQRRSEKRPKTRKEHTFASDEHKSAGTGVRVRGKADRRQKDQQCARNDDHLFALHFFLFAVPKLKKK